MSEYSALMARYCCIIGVCEDSFLRSVIYSEASGECSAIVDDRCRRPAVASRQERAEPGLRQRALFHVLAFVLVVVRARRLQTAGVLQGAAQDELELAVHAAQLVVGPALQRIEHRGIGPQ